MKILVLTNAYPPYITGGYEIACYDNVQKLRSKGHEVHVLTSDYRKFEKDPLDSDPKVYRELMLEAKFYQFQPTPILKFNSLRQRIAKHRDIAIFTRYLKTIQPDIIFFWNMGLISFFIIEMACRLKPTAFYISDSWLAYPPLYIEYKDCNTLKLVDIPNGYKRLITETVRPRVIQLSFPKNLIFCSHALKQHYLELGYPVENGVVIHHGVDFNIFYPNPSHMAESETIRLLFCGRIAQIKGIETVVYALDKLIHTHQRKNFSLSIVGNGSDTYIQMLKTEILKLSLENHIHWIPSIKRELLREIYWSHDILIFPSIWVEPFSLTILEAMASGIPVIGTTTGGSKEILKDNENSLVFKEDNSEQLADKVELAAKDLELRNRIRDNALQIVKEYSLDNMANKIEIYLKSVVDNHSKSVIQ